jgi:hypothetical protein
MHRDRALQFWRMSERRLNIIGAAGASVVFIVVALFYVSRPELFIAFLSLAASVVIGLGLCLLFDLIRQATKRPRPRGFDVVFHESDQRKSN